MRWHVIKTTCHHTDIRHSDGDKMKRARKILKPDCATLHINPLVTVSPRTACMQIHPEYVTGLKKHVSTNALSLPS